MVIQIWKYHHSGKRLTNVGTFSLEGCCLQLHTSTSDNAEHNTMVWPKLETWDSQVLTLPGSHEWNQGQKAVKVKPTTRPVACLKYKLLKRQAWNGLFVWNREQWHDIWWVFPSHQGMSLLTHIHQPTRTKQLDSYILVHTQIPTSLCCDRICPLFTLFEGAWSNRLLGLWERTWINGTVLHCSMMGAAKHPEQKIF